MFAHSSLRSKQLPSYEIQLKESARGKGLGEYLMKLLQEIGIRWHMEKVMLTVFKGNLLRLYLRGRFGLTYTLFFSKQRRI
jgi:GNAT superfamily N-acetyltransferase